MSRDVSKKVQRRLAMEARKLRREKVLDELIRGNIDTFDIARKLSVSERTVRRDKDRIHGWFAEQFKTLSNAIPAIHTQMLLGYFRVLKMANEIIDTSKDPGDKIAAGYLAESAMGKIMEASGSNSKLIDHYIQQFRKKVEIERRAHIQCS